jgi:diketogulonate reductase-like aldo/keto reductase
VSAAAGGPGEASGPDAPPILYGTAWKEERTAHLVSAALAAGFRGVDTANQRRHYHEAGVGAALAAAFAAGDVRRDELFLQTKFTYAEGQDHRLPFDPGAPWGEQVRQSVRSSRQHLGVDRLDSLLLHGPRARHGLSQADREVWCAFEELHDEGAVGSLGASNVTAAQLVELCRLARVRPAWVQNRCFAVLGWDREVRAVCAGEGVAYQGFSLLTANREVVTGPVVGAIARRHAVTPAQVVFAFARRLGMVPLTGTTDRRHMAEDLAAMSLRLDAEEVLVLEGVAG